jgi:hypothetical protein
MLPALGPTRLADLLIQTTRRRILERVDWIQLHDTIADILIGHMPKKVLLARA